MRLVLLGPPGSGKGTQAKRLSDRFQLPQISSGDLFREKMAQKTALGLQLESYLRQGLLAPDELTCEIVFKRLDQINPVRGFILDGFPRNLAQAVSLDEFLNKGNLKLDGVFYLDADEDVLLQRLSQRRQCKNCHRVYNLLSRQQTEGVCDSCGGFLFARDDDRPETIQRRLLVYKDSILALVKHYENRGLLVRIQASKAIDEVTEDLMGVLRSCQR